MRNGRTIEIPGSRNDAKYLTAISDKRTASHEPYVIKLRQDLEYLAP